MNAGSVLTLALIVAVGMVGVYVWNVSSSASIPPMHVYSGTITHVHAEGRLTQQLGFGSTVLEIAVGGHYLECPIVASMQRLSNNAAALLSLKVGDNVTIVYYSLGNLYAVSGEGLYP